jgi:hypothetical protein
VEVLDSNGLYQVVYPITLEEIREQGYSVSEFYKTPDMPIYYLLDGRSILLFPKPSSSKVTTTAGLKVYFDRDIDAFEITDTATQPGFDTNFHRIISVGAANDYANSRQMTNAIVLTNNKLTLLKNDLQEFYSTRAVEKKPQIRIIRESGI